MGGQECRSPERSLREWELRPETGGLGRGWRLVGREPAAMGRVGYPEGQRHNVSQGCCSLLLSYALTDLFPKYSVSCSAPTGTHTCVTPPCLRWGQDLSQPDHCRSSFGGGSLGSKGLLTRELCLIRQHLRLIARAFLNPPTEINAEEPIW